MIDFNAANVLGLLDWRSLANGIAINASKEIMSANHRIYSECAWYCKNSAIEFLKKKTIAKNKAVVEKIEIPRWIALKKQSKAKINRPLSAHNT